MADRVSADDLAVAEMAVRHEAECYEEDDETCAALIRVADWLFTHRQQRYRRMALRQIPDPLGFRAVTPRPPLNRPEER